MNIVKILLVLGLGYVATTQKVEKTKNMLLVVTGLLAFCMFSMEGFTIDFSTLTSFSGSEQTVSGRTITVGSGANQIVYTLPSSRYDSSQPIPATGYSCTIGDPGSPGVIGKSSAPDYDSADGVPGTGADITKIFTCEANDDSATPACEGYDSTNKPPFCECLKKTEGGHYNCNSGWTGDPGSLGKYIAKNAAGDGWEFKDDYSDENVLNCDADMLSSISGGAVELFSGKCYVKKDATDATQECLNLCDAPTSS
tara:strand:- start:5905 stop:6666 length:762 start_codon:yes stop_codon:yes gene_type:complete